MRTFFSWFVDNQDPATDDISEVFKDDLWRNPLRYYLISRQASLLEGENGVDKNTTSVFELLPENWEDGIWPSLNPKDFESLNDADLRFRTLIKLVKNEKLFPLVLPIILKNCGMDKPSELLIWRSVNKAAKSIVEDLLEESTSPENYQDESGIYSPLWTPVLGSAEEDLRLVTQKIKSRYQFSTESRFERFFARMNSTHGVALANPFLTKSLVLEDSLDDDVDVAPADRLPNQLLMAMLQRYGHLIRSFTIRYFDVPFLFSVLSRLPNLRILVVGYEFDPFSEDDIRRRVSQMRLDQLEVLDMGFDGGESEEPVFHPLLSCVGPRLQTLVFDADICETAANLETLRQGRSPNLRAVRVKGAHPALMTEFFGIPSPLQEIELIDWEFGYSIEASFAEMSRHIGAFASTLTHLKLYDSLGTDEDGEDDVDNLVSYYNLSTLTVNCKSIEEEWFGKFLQFQAPLLAELNLRVNPEKNLVSEILLKLQEQQVFKKAPTLQRINILAGFKIKLDPYKTEKAEKVVIERSGTVTTILYKKLLQDKSINY